MSKLLKGLIILFAVSLLVVMGISLYNTAAIEGEFNLIGMSQAGHDLDEDMLIMALGENYNEENHIIFRKNKSFTLTLEGQQIEGSYVKKRNGMSKVYSFVLLSRDGRLGKEVYGTLDRNIFTLEVEGNDIFGETVITFEQRVDE